MRKAKVTRQLGPSNSILHTPAYPKFGSEVVRKLKELLDLVECLPGQKLTWEQFGQLLGAPRSTVHDWNYGDLVAPIRQFLCGLERLSEAQRSDLFRALCRECPRLQHPKLAHDQPGVETFKALLTQQNGLTFLIGATDNDRTFVLTAAGNAAAQLVAGKKVCGLDVHSPDLFVPAPGLIYFQNPKDSTTVKQLIRETWGQIENSPARLVLLNGVWNLAPEMRDGIVALAKNHQVIVADHFPTGFDY